MNLSELLATTPESLAEKQLKSLKEDTIDTLQTMINHIKCDRYSDAWHMLCNSPSGDGTGSDNCYIAFYMGDIAETLDKLQQLDKQSQTGSLI